MGVKNTTFDNAAPVPATQVAATYEAMDIINTNVAKKKPEIIEDGGNPLPAAQIATLSNEMNDVTNKPPVASSN